jgi:hypothetical protein
VRLDAGVRVSAARFTHFERAADGSRLNRESGTLPGASGSRSAAACSRPSPQSGCWMRNLMVRSSIDADDRLRVGAGAGYRQWDRQRHQWRMPRSGARPLTRDGVRVGQVSQPQGKTTLQGVWIGWRYAWR